MRTLSLGHQHYRLRGMQIFTYNYFCSIITSLVCWAHLILKLCVISSDEYTNLLTFIIITLNNFCVIHYLTRYEVIYSNALLCLLYIFAYHTSLTFELKLITLNLINNKQSLIAVCAELDLSIMRYYASTNALNEYNQFNSVYICNYNSSLHELLLNNMTAIIWS